MLVFSGRLEGDRTTLSLKKNPKKMMIKIEGGVGFRALVVGPLKKNFLTASLSIYMRRVYIYYLCVEMRSQLIDPLFFLLCTVRPSTR